MEISDKIHIFISRRGGYFMEARQARFKIPGRSCLECGRRAGLANRVRWICDGFTGGLEPANSAGFFAVHPLGGDFFVFVGIEIQVQFVQN